MTNFKYYNDSTTLMTIEAITPLKLLTTLATLNTCIDIEYNIDILNDILKVLEPIRLLSVKTIDKRNMYNYIINDGTKIIRVTVEDGFIIFTSINSSLVISRLIQES